MDWIWVFKEKDVSQMTLRFQASAGQMVPFTERRNFRRRFGLGEQDHECRF